MKYFNLFLLLFLLGFQGLLANNQSASNALFWKIDAPTDFHVTTVSTHTAEVAWTAVPDAAQYRIITYDKTTGSPVHDITVPGSSTTAELTWPDFSYGHQFSAKAWSIDANGVEGTTYALVDFIGVILELVATGYSANVGTETNCNLTTSSAHPCSNFTWGAGIETTYRVHYFEGTRERTFYYTINGNYPVIRLSYDSVEAYPFVVINEYNRFVIRYNGLLVAGLKGDHVSVNSIPIGKHYLLAPMVGGTLGNPNYIEKLGEINVFRPADTPSRVRTSNESLTSLEVKVSPNPFQDALQLQFANFNEEKETTIHLYNLLGSVKRTLIVPANQAEISINTQDLSAGIYFVRIESGNQVQTIKVVKGQ